MDTSNVNKIVTFLNSISRNRLIILQKLIGTDFIFTDIGSELAKALEHNLKHKQISMLTTDLLEVIIHRSERSHPLIGKYVAITNMGMMMEPSLKINLPSFLDTHSQNCSLIVAWEGEIEKQNLYFLSKEKGKVVNLEGISHIVL